MHDAAGTWARRVFGAPREFADLITSIEVRDEVLERVLSEVVRRDVREERIACNRREQSPARVDPNGVDPFQISVAALRAQSEHVEPCGYCRGAGVCTCPACDGAGRARCGSCAGSGKTVKQYQKSSRLINCTVCRASGTVRCGGCNASGNVTCTVCSGSGYQLVWLTYEQESRWTVFVAPESPVVAAHGQLVERRFLAPAELDAFSILATEEASGPVTLRGYRGQDNAILQSVLHAIDPRLERINRQQYHRLAVVRRDAIYSMCGTSGTLVLSGKDLAGAKTGHALAPIQRRLYVWGTLTAVVAAGTAIVANNLRGASPYFAGTNPVVTMLAVVAVALAVPALGAVLRAVRPGWKLRAIRPFEKYLAIATAVLFASMIVVGVVARPRVGEVHTALMAGNASRARTVLTALQETSGQTAEVRDTEDAVQFAEAMALKGEPRLKGLEEVAERHGKRAGDAVTAVRADRLAEIRKIQDAKTPAPALAAIDRWFPSTWKADGEISEERARAQDLAGSLCSDEPCRFHTATLANAAAKSDVRGQRVTEMRTGLVDALATSDIQGEELLVRLKRLRVLSAVGTKSVEIAHDDPELLGRAEKAAEWADTERAKVPLLGADLPVVEELVGGAAVADGKATYVLVDGTRAYLNLDAQKKCRGVYLVGKDKGARAIRGAIWPPDRLLSQALGHSASVKKPAPDGAVTARWFDVSAGVVARWEYGDVIELRIGAAAP